MDADLITDDEFEQLLDDLHGSGKGPAPVGAKQSDKTTAPADEVTPRATVAVCLSEDATIGEVKKLHKTLLAQLDSDGELTINASAVDVIDTATLQLLYAVCHERELSLAPVQIVEPTEAFLRAAQRLGLSGKMPLVETSDEAA